MWFIYRSHPSHKIDKILTSEVNNDQPYQRYMIKCY